MLGDSDFPFTRLMQDQVCGLPGCPFSVSCVDIRDGAARMGLPALSNAKAPWPAACCKQHLLGWGIWLA